MFLFWNSWHACSLIPDCTQYAERGGNKASEAWVRLFAGLRSLCFASFRSRKLNCPFLPVMSSDWYLDLFFSVIVPLAY